MATVADVTLAHLSGQALVDAVLDWGPGWNYLTPSHGNVLRYTFSIAEATESALHGAVTPNLGLFNPAQQAAARLALSDVTQITGIQFVETADGNAADLHFAAYNIDAVRGWTRWYTQYNYDGVGNLTYYTVDSYVYLDNVEGMDINAAPAPGAAPYGWGYELLLHELGHALGLKHPFESPYPGAVTLPANLDTTDNTLMSYTGFWDGEPHTTYQPYDLAALDWLYGGDGLGGSLGLNGSGNGSAPLAVGFTPADEAENVAIASGIVVTFNEPIQRGAGSIVLKTVAGVTVETYNAATSANLSIVGSTLAIDPTAVLSYGTGYRVEFAAGTVKDVAGSSYAGTTAYNFTTSVGGTAGSDAVNGTNGSDRIEGLGNNDVLFGGPGNDTLVGGAGNDTLDGGAGADTVVYSGVRSGYSIPGVAAGTVTGPDGIDTVSNIERYQFPDRNLAFDLGFNQAAGSTVRVIGAAFDAPAIQQHPDWVDIGLQFFDSNMPMLQVCGLVAQVMGLGNTAFVDRVYTNVVGAAPDTATRDAFASMLQGSGGSMTQGQLLEIAATISLNEANIDLVGLRASGVEFV